MTICCRPTSPRPAACRSTSWPRRERRDSCWVGRPRTRPRAWRPACTGTWRTRPTRRTPTSARTTPPWRASKLRTNVTRRYRPFDPFERGPREPPREIRIPRPPRRFWIGSGLVGIAILVFLFASPVVTIITELQWYDALGFRDVYATRVLLQTWLFVRSFLVALVFLAVNVLIALRVRTGPGLRAVGIKRPVVRSVAGIVALSASALVALILSGGAGSQWQALVLFQHAAPTGTTDPGPGQAIPFFLLSLPFLHSAVNWAPGVHFR